MKFTALSVEIGLSEIETDKLFLLRQKVKARRDQSRSEMADTGRGLMRIISVNFLKELGSISLRWLTPYFSAFLRLTTRKAYLYGEPSFRCSTLLISTRDTNCY